MKKAVLFDLDGTVLASQQGVFRSVAYALGRLGLTVPTDEQLMAFLGPPLTMGFSEVCHVPAHNIDDAVRLYREYYTRTGMLEAFIYEGVADVLSALQARGVRCYITTSKPVVYARRILEYFGIETLFDAVYGSELDGTRVKKAEVLRYCLEQQCLSPDDVVLVGDRRYDVIGAADIGIPCVGVTYGYGTSEELREAGATVIVGSAEELKRQLYLL